jgi:hypothetical protein
MLWDQSLVISVRLDCQVGGKHTPKSIAANGHDVKRKLTTGNKTTSRRDPSMRHCTQTTLMGGFTGGGVRGVKPP